MTLLPFRLLPLLSLTCAVCVFLLRNLGDIYLRLAGLTAHLRLKKNHQMKDVHCFPPPRAVLIRGTPLRCLSPADRGPVATFVTASPRNENCVDLSCRLGRLSSAQPAGSLAAPGFCAHQASSLTPGLPGAAPAVSSSWHGCLSAQLCSVVS